MPTMDTLDQPTTAVPRTAGRGLTVAALIAMGLVLAVATAIRLRLLAMPLERDEGEYAYMGQLLLQGVPPYGEAANMKWPGTYAAYAAIMAVFGQSTAGIHFGLLLVNLASTGLVFVLGRRAAGTVGGAAAASIHAILTIGPYLFGLAAHATHFVAVFSLGGLVLLTGSKPAGRWRIFTAGLLFGLATLMKQNGAVFGVFAAGWLVWQGRFVERRGYRALAARAAVLVAGGLVPLAAVAAWLWQAGVWSGFWFWTVQYAAAYGSITTLPDGLARLWFALTTLAPLAPGLWLAAAAGGFVLWRWPAVRRWRLFLTGLTALSFAAVCPGLYFRLHYFLLLMPALALLGGVAAAGLADGLAARGRGRMAAAVPGLLLAAGIAQALWVGRGVFFTMSPVQACMAIYGDDPFPEAVEIGRYLREHVAPGARIAVVGSEPEIYFYARRRSATPYLYTYALVEPQPYAARMQQEFIRGIEAADPDYIVYVFVVTSWCKSDDAPRDVFKWFPRYQQEHFQFAGMIDLGAPGGTDYRWAGSASDLRPRSAAWIAVLRNNRLGNGRTTRPPGS